MINLSLVIKFLLAEDAHSQSMNIFMKQKLGKGSIEGLSINMPLLYRILSTRP